MVYDILGRLLIKTGPEGQYNYIYDIDTDNKGSLSQETTPDGIFSSYTYDNLGRISKTSQNIQGNIFDFSYSFDIFGNLKEETYPGGFTLENMYNERGFLKQVNNKQGSQPLWSLVDVNSKGQPLEVLLGNGLTTYRNYDTYGYLTSVKTGITETTGLVQDYTYQFAPVWGRPEWRNNAFAGQEDFYYDEDGLKLNRLASVVNITGNTGITYAANGNIATKTGLGGYGYQLPQPHAVSTVENTNNILPDVRQDITYTYFNKTETITEGEKQLLLTYGTANQRVKTEFYNNQILEKTKYFASNYELEETPQGTRELNYIAGPMGMAAIFVKENGTEQMYYTHSDHLGSITEITDQQGILQQRITYNAWGERELVYNNSNSGFTGFMFDRGFTGHEHLDQFKLINMNGRLYDPLLGRMLSPDPFVQDPANSQNYNRYSYALNNPLVYTDPGGYRYNGGGGGGSYYIDGTQVSSNMFYMWVKRSMKNDPWNDWTIQGFGLIFEDFLAMSIEAQRLNWMEDLKYASYLWEQELKQVGLAPRREHQSYVESSFDMILDGDPLKKNKSTVSTDKPAYNTYFYKPAGENYYQNNSGKSWLSDPKSFHNSFLGRLLYPDAWAISGIGSFSIKGGGSFEVGLLYLNRGPSAGNYKFFYSSTLQAGPNISGGFQIIGLNYTGQVKDIGFSVFKGLSLNLAAGIFYLPKIGGTLLWSPDFAGGTKGILGRGFTFGASGLPYTLSYGNSWLWYQE